MSIAQASALFGKLLRTDSWVDPPSFETNSAAWPSFFFVKRQRISSALCTSFKTTACKFRPSAASIAGMNFGSTSICATSEPGVDLIAADRNFDGRILLSDPRCLARAIAPIKPNYDVVLLDSPPVAANLIVCALLASEGVLVPTALDYLALDGVRQFARSYHHVMVKLQATLLGFAITPMQVDFRTNMQRLVLANLHTGFGSDQVMRGIRTDVSLAEAFGDRRPLRQFRINSRAVDDFRVLADDVTRRFNLS